MDKRLLLLIIVLFGIQGTGMSQKDSTYQEIDEVLISSERKKDIAFEDSKYYIVDFTVSDSRAILLMRNFSTYYIYQLDENMNLRHKLRLNMNANYLFDDCFGNTHVVTKDSVYFIMHDTFGLFLTETHPRLQFMNAMKKCAGTTSDKIIFENRTRFNQFQKFYTVDLDSGDRKVIYEINDSTISRSLADAAMLMNTEDYYSNHIRMGDINGSKEASAVMRGINEDDDRGSFFYSHVTRPKYNPLFVVDDTLYFFNHSEGRIDQMDDMGNKLNSHSIKYQFKDGWKKLVYSDITTKKFYAVWIENGVQQLIGLALNEDEQNYSTKITKHAFPKKVFVRNGYVYYTYKPNYDANLNKLYRQKL